MSNVEPQTLPEALVHPGQVEPEENGEPKAAGRVVMARMTTLKAHDRTFDLEFWQAHDSRARMNAAWEMVVHYLRRRGHTDDELRLQRTVVRFRRPRS
ncbi:MAG: hypothetical protein IT208_16220 [Chthonomonadales bacterium]|nr:hypothetical protein [Chthonomonadales bacterium]